MRDVQIDCFQAVVKYGSFSAAAEKLYVTQSAVSKQIRLLEEEWAVTLFDRKPHTTVLTAAGQIMLDYVRQSSALLQSALAQARHAEWSPAVRAYRVGVLEGMRIGLLSPTFSEYIHKTPNASIEIEEGHFVALNEGLFQGEYQMIVTLESMIRDRAALGRYPFAVSHLAAVIPRTSPLAAKPDLCLADLKDQWFFMPEQGENDPGTQKAKRVCREGGFELKKIKRTANIQSAILSAKLNNGVVLLDDFVFLEHSDEFVPIPLPYQEKVVFAWKKDDPAPLAPELIRILERRFADQLPAADSKTSIS